MEIARSLFLPYTLFQITYLQNTEEIVTKSLIVHLEQSGFLFLFPCAYILNILIRLVCPVSFPSPFNFINLLSPVIPQNTGTLVYVPYNIGLEHYPKVNAGIASLNNAVITALPRAIPIASVNPMQIILSLLSITWAGGVVLLILYGLISYHKVLHKIKTATLLKANIFETDQIATPFVNSFIKPKIYIPTGISPNELSYILARGLSI